jgi:hypothetical protein
MLRIIDKSSQTVFKYFAVDHIQTYFILLVSTAPHQCNGRLLLVKTAYDQTNSSDYQSNYSSDHLCQTTVPTNENFNSTTMDNNSIFDDDNHNRLASIRDELEANLECMQIAHEHEIKILREKLAREKKRRKEAEESYKEVEEDWRQVNEENVRIRTSLIKNVMQTFNIRKDLARRTKDQLKKCDDIKSKLDNLKISTQNN